MDAPPRPWVLKPLSPVLQQSDLRTLSTGPAQTSYSLNHQGSPEAPGRSLEVASSQQDPGSPDVLFQAQHVTVFQDGVISNDECPPSSPSNPSSPSSGSQSGFYSFVEDPGSPEAELNQAWMLSPQRHAQLATLKVEKEFKLQTYASSRKPQSLFSEEGDQPYQVDLNDSDGAAEEEEEEDENLLRSEIIRHQAPRGAPKLVEGSAHASTTQQLWPADPGTIDKDSINFTAARQQFLRLEQDREPALLKPVSFRLKASPRPEENHHEDTSQTHEVQQSSVADVQDSAVEGLSSSTTSSSSSVEAAWSSSSNKQPPVEKRSISVTEQETPIEREIRLIQQREEDLRLSRGLKISTAEIVEIKTKRLLSPLSPSKATNLQQEIQETKRKDNLVDLGDLQRKPENPRSPEPQSQDTTDFPSPCCPHRHAEGTESDISLRLSDTPSLPEDRDAGSVQPEVASLSDVSSPSRTMDTSRSWRENLQLNGLQSRKSGAPDFIEKEIEEALKREEELRELRTSREDSSPRASPAARPASTTTDNQIHPAAHSGTTLTLTLTLTPNPDPEF